MKYAELRKRLRDAEKRAAQMDTQRAAAFRLLLEVAQKRECGHRVIALESWPCPHPECSGRRGSLLIRDVPPLAFTMAQHAAELPRHKERTLLREQVVAGGQVVWMWRQA